MQRSNEYIQDGNDVTVAAFIRVGVPVDIRQRPNKGQLARLVGMLRAWRRRERERRELAAMGRRDFGDLTVPPSLVADEVRRWPWQKPSLQWGQIETRSRRGDEGQGPDNCAPQCDATSRRRSPDWRTARAMHAADSAWTLS
ncbi:MAG TPA: hypothetical protein VN900_06190 [Stellaceae bacterium]|jgi:uncharacterized protein YjiS (DUF1127 family)|nr:hypothetical protein [Stellaceae bacterium]